MLVSDLVNQYNNTLNSGSKIAKKTKGIEQLSKTVKSLEKGQVFEGTVKDVRGDKVTLSLSSGQSITARLDKSISLEKGQSVFFQVKSNEGGTVQIKPVSSEFGGNPTLLNALKGAGLPENETNLKLLNAMMKEQMPIDMASVKDMVKTMRANPGADIDTLVSLKKLDLPINESMITQFENYKESEGAILKMVNELSDDIPKALSADNVSKEDVIAFQNELIDIISDGGEDFIKANVSLLKGEGATTFSNSVSINNVQTGDGQVIIDGKAVTPVTPEDSFEVDTITGKADALNPETKVSAGSQDVISKNSETIINNTAAADTTAESTTATNIQRESVGTILNPEDSVKLTNTLRELPRLREMAPQMFTEDGRLNPETKASDLLKTLNTYFSVNTNVSKTNILNFLESSPAKALINNLMENAWTMEPKELVRKNSINKLYEKIEEDMQKIIETSKNTTHVENNAITNTAQSVKDNLSFIREVNQLYQYVQIPLQMSGENTTGELYVYANKKQKRAENDEITAFLHFEMENLGSTDISVKLAGKKINTKFYLEDDLSYNLISENLHILESRLEELGYTCKLTAENDSNTVNFVEDFLKQDSKSAGDIRRYSFDVRA